MTRSRSYHGIPFPPPGYGSETVSGTKLIARADAIGFARKALATSGTLYDFAAVQPDAEAIEGRGRIYIIPGPTSRRWVVRHLSHGGLLAPITGDRFLNVGHPRPFNELSLSVKLSELGIATPAVVAAVLYPAGMSYRGDVAREEIDNALDLADCLFKSGTAGPGRSAAIAAAGGLIGSLHAAGVIHPDLNIRNVLIQHGGDRPIAYILDTEKCRLTSRLSQSARRGMLERFERSARKFESRTGSVLDSQEWQAFSSAYDRALKQG